MNPPRWAERLFLWYCKASHQEFLLGDLYELFDHHLEEKGLFQARLRFVLGVFDLCRPFVWKRFSPPKLYYHRDMLQHYFKIGWRNLLRQRFFSLINILGLSLGLAACLLMLLFVRHELSFDTFHQDSEKMVRVWTEFKEQNESFNASVTPNIVLPLLRRSYPEQVLNGTRVYQNAPLVHLPQETFRETRCLYVDSTFLEVFSFELLQGDRHSLLQNPTSVVLTETMAQRLFGQEEAMGKIVSLGNSKSPFQVTGVMADPPANSQLEFRMLIPFHNMRWASEKETFGSANYATFLKLDRPESGPELEAKFLDVLFEMGGEELTNSISYHFQPFEKVYLHSSHISSYGPVKSGDIRYIYLFSLLAFLVLIIALINYLNLTTSRSIDRAKEVGLRKVIGAQRKQLVQQFLGETTLVALISLGLAILLVMGLIQPFGELVDRELSGQSLLEPHIILSLFGGGILLGILAGIYPAMILSGFKPIAVLRGKFGNSRSGLWLRRILVVFQFTVSITLIASAIIIHQQIQFIQEKKLGYDRERVLYVYTGGQPDSTLAALRIELAQDPAVLGTTSATEPPHNIQGGYGLELGDGKEESIMVQATMIDDQFLPTMNIELLAGRNYTPFQAQQSPEDGEFAFIINEQVVKLLGGSTEEAIGKPMDLNGRKGVVQGVVRDFHFSSLHKPIGPMVFFNDVHRRQLFIKLAPGAIASHLLRVSDIWQTNMPGMPFDYHFLDDSYEELYRSEKQTRQFALVFAGLAIFIAALGLLGLAAYSIVQRTKEIGIRKVLGANVFQLIVLMSREFTVLVGIAFVLGTTLSLYLMNRWLESFSYRNPLHWEVFAVSGLTALLIAWGTVSGLAFRAAQANPVESIRSE